MKTVAKNITEFRNLGELDLEWGAFTEILDENANRVRIYTNL